MEHYLKQVESSSSEPKSSAYEDLKEAILVIVGLFESLLNIEVNETDSSTYPYPKYQLQVELDEYADLIEAVISVRYHYGLFTAHQLLSLNWLLKYKPNSAVIMAAAIRVFSRAAASTKETGSTDEKRKKKQLYVLLTLTKFLSEVTVPNNVRPSRSERLEVLVKQVRTLAATEAILEEAGQLMDRFKGGWFGLTHIYDYIESKIFVASFRIHPRG